MLHVCLLPSAFHPHRGGIEAVALETGRELRRRGHRVTVVTNRHPTDLPPTEDVDGLHVVRIAFAVPRRSPVGMARYLGGRREADTALRSLDLQPDVVHVHGVSSQAPGAMTLARSSGARLVVTTHGEITGDAHALYQRSRWARRNLRRLAEAADAVTAPSRAVVAAAAAEGLALPAHTVIIANGVDDAWRSVPPVPAGSARVGAWGRLSPEKGFDLLLRAWPEVRRARPDASLWIGGSGPDRERLARGVGEGVELVPATSHDEIRARLADTKVVVVPSRQEAYGIVAFEALAAGRLVVYNSATAMHETVGATGRGVDASDPAALAAAVLAALGETPRDDPARPVRTWSEVTDDYLRLYRGLLRLVV